MRVPPWVVCVFPWGIPRLQSDWSLSCDHGLDYASYCENINNNNNRVHNTGLNICFLTVIGKRRMTRYLDGWNEKSRETQFCYGNRLDGNGKNTALYFAFEVVSYYCAPPARSTGGRREGQAPGAAPTTAPRYRP